MSTTPSSNVGPLTTTYTPPASCDSTFVAKNTANTWLQRGPAEEDGQVSCLPPDWTRDELVYYSPGICPSGYSSVCGQGTTTGSSTATATCCPQGYICRDEELAANDPNICKSDIATELTSVVSSFSYGETGFVDSGIVTWTFTPGTWIGARGVVVQRQSTDPTWATAEATSTEPSTPASSSIPETSSSTSSTSSPISPTTPPSDGGSGETDDGGLSQGAKIGIGVGVSMGVMALIAIIYVAYSIGKSRRRSAAAAAAASAPDATDGPHQQSSQNNYGYAGVPATEFGGSTANSPDMAAAWKTGSMTVTSSNPASPQPQQPQQVGTAELEPRQGLSEMDASYHGYPAELPTQSNYMR